MRTGIIAAAGLALLIGCAEDAPETAETTAPWEATDAGSATPAAPGTQAPIAVPQPADAGRVTVAQLEPKLASGQVVLLDVRNPDSYAAIHAAGAVNIPLHEVATRANELPLGKQIVAYCT